MDRNRDNFLSVRVGAYGIRPTNGHIGGRTNQNRGDFSSVRVGTCGIRPTNEHIGVRTNQKMTGSVVHLFTYNEERADQYVRLLFSDRAVGAYAIRPYPDRRKRGRFLCPPSVGEGVFWRGRASLRCWEDENWGCFPCVSFSFSCLDWGKRDKRKSSPRRGRVFCPSSVGDGVDWRGWTSFIYKYCMERHTGA